MSALHPNQGRNRRNRFAVNRSVYAPPLYGLYNCIYNQAQRTGL